MLPPRSDGQPSEATASAARLPKSFQDWFAARGWQPRAHQLKLLEHGSRASGALPGCAELGVQPKPLGLFLDRWMVRYRKHGRFGDKREAA